MPEVPGLGIVIGIVAIYFLGVLVTSRLTRWIYKPVESPLRYLPVEAAMRNALTGWMEEDTDTSLSDGAPSNS